MVAGSSNDSADSLTGQHCSASRAVLIEGASNSPMERTHVVEWDRKEVMMKPAMKRTMVLYTLVMAFGRRKPEISHLI